MLDVTVALFRRRLVMSGPKDDLLESDEPVVRQFLRGSTQGPIGMSEEKDAPDPGLGRPEEARQPAR